MDSQNDNKQSMPGEAAPADARPEIEEPPAEPHVDRGQTVCAGQESMDVGDVAGNANAFNERICWICFCSETEDDYEFINPCQCIGTTKWVHEICLHRWIDEKQSGNRHIPVFCPQCQFRYVIVYVQNDLLFRYAQAIDNLINRACPLIVGGLFASSLYWNGCCFGVVTMVEVMGSKRGLTILEEMHPIVLLVTMPIIPFFLVMCQTVPWQEGLFGFMQRLHRGARNMGILRPPPVVDQHGMQLDNQEFMEPEEAFAEAPSAADEMLGSRILCGAVLLPTMAVIIGKTFFSRFNSDLNSAMLGGVVVIGIKGIFYNYIQSAKRRLRSKIRIISYDPNDDDLTT